MKAITRRAALLGLGGLGGLGLSKAFRPNLPVIAGNELIAPAPSESVMNDASGLSATPIHKHIVLQDDASQTLIDTLRRELAEARAAKRPVMMGAARHSMGGQAIPRSGTALTFDNAQLEVDTQNATYRVHAGARWSQVIAALDPLGFSPKVMQSNNDFGVAATFSVNAHGWPVPFGPMGSTVRSLRMVLASGDVVTCSRSENASLFAHAMGGYGLIGIILDLEVEMVANTRLVPFVQTLPAADFAAQFAAAVADPSVSMAYGRLNVQRSSFFTQALLVSYRAAEDQSDLPAASGSGWMSHAASRIYRAQLGNEWMKSVRWWNETVLGPALGGGEVTRNSLINEPVVTLDDRNPSRTDILHEYFVGFDRFGAFLDICRAIIPASYQEFLNVTLRFVGQDDTSVLAYANVPRIAAVMSFSQEMTQRSEADMARMTAALTDAVTAIGGTYYLPYRPHAQPAQMPAAYPRAAAFAREKRALDTDLVLRSALWDRYLQPL
jgi:FAD/FMN-containing dehydrogenase